MSEFKFGDVITIKDTRSYPEWEDIHFMVLAMRGGTAIGLRLSTKLPYGRDARLIHEAMASSAFRKEDFDLLATI